MSTINFIFFAVFALTQTTAFAEMIFDINNSSYKVQHDGSEPITYDQLLAANGNICRCEREGFHGVTGNNHSVMIFLEPPYMASNK